MLRIHNNFENIADNWRLDLEPSLSLDILIPHLACFIPFSSVVTVPVHTIIGVLKSDSIDGSVLVAAAAISSSH